MRVAFWIAVVPALLGTTAVYAAGAASAGITIGAGAIKMPSGQNGVLTLGDVDVTGNSDPLLPALSVGLNAAASIGKVGDLDAFVGVNLFATYGTASWSGTQNFSGIGTVIIPGVSLPDSGSIVVATTQGDGVIVPGAAYFDVDDVPPTDGAIHVDGIGTTTPGNINAQTAGLVDSSTNDEAFVVGGVNTDGDGRAMSYGGIADPTGSLLIITGDLEGLSISTSTTTQVLYAGGDLTVGVTKVQDETSAIQAYAGPSYRYLGQWTNKQVGASGSLTVDLPEYTNTTDHALWIQDTIFQTSLNSHYFGGVVGAGTSKVVSDGVTVSVGAEASLYYLQSYMNGRGSVTTQDGDPPNSPPVTVVQNPFDVTQGAMAYAVRGQASASFDVAENASLTLAGTVDYLSAVARPYAGPAVTQTGGTVSWSSSNPDNSAVSFGDMFVFTGTATLSGHF